MDYQRTNRDRFCYLRSRFFVLDAKDPTVETWMYIDDYEDQEAFNRMMETWESDVEIAKLKAKFMKEFKSLRVPDSFKEEVWIEKPELGV